MVAHAHFARRVDILHHHVVVHGYVARRLVGHVHVVALLDQTYERAAHRYHVVIGVGREDQHALGIWLRRGRPCRVVGVGLASRPASYGVLQIVEYVDVDSVVCLAGAFEQLAQRVLDIVEICQFQYRLVDDAAEPYDGLADEFGRPAAGAYQPRRLLAREQAGGILVDDNLYVGVLLQVRGRHHVGYFALDHALHGIGLLFAPCHEDYPVGAHDRVESHGYGHFGRILQPEEERRLHLARVVGQLHQTRVRSDVRSRLVEADLPLLSHADNHQVDIAHVLIESGAVLRYAVERNGAVGDMDVFGEDVYMVEEVLVYAVVAALLLGARYGVELVERVDGHTREADGAGAVASDQLAVESQRRASGGQTQHERTSLVEHVVDGCALLVRAYHAADDVGDILHAAVFAVEHLRAYLLAAVDYVPRRSLLDKAAVARQLILVVHYGNCKVR